jgi:uncharacterized protein
MRTFLFLIALALRTSAFGQEPPPPAPPVDPAKMAAIQEFLKLTSAEQMMLQMLAQFEGAFSQGIKQSTSAIPQAANHPELQTDVDSFQKQLFAIIRERLSFERLQPALVKLYDETFSLEELSSINAFYRSSAGQAYLAKIPS